MMRELLLSLDCGTQSVRALVFDLTGNLLKKTQIKLEYESPFPGWGEQRPEYFWEKLCMATRTLWNEVPEFRTQIAGVSLTTQRGTVINLDENGESLRAAITWFDQRINREFKKIPVWDLIFKAIGMSDAIRFFQKQTEALWIYQNQPEIWEKTFKYLLLSGYLNYKLTGNFVDSIASQVGYIPFDFKRQNWAPPYDWKWKLIPAKKDMLPELKMPTQILGHITKKASEETGIEEGLPVIASGSDKACETLGCGVIDDSLIHLSFGTTATVNVVSKKYREVIPFIPPYPFVIPEHYTMEIQIFRGFWLVSWFKEQFAESEKKDAELKKCSVEELLEEKIKLIPPGSEGLILQPYWSPGIRIPGPEAKGSIIGFSDWHTKYHLYRAILEGIAYSLREGTEKIETKIGKRINKIHIGGGGSNSDVAMQITADIFNRVVERPKISEASGLGAAIIMAVALGFYKNFSEAVQKMYKKGKEFFPEPENHKKYNHFYEKGYLKIYNQLRGIYKSIVE